MRKTMLLTFVLFVVSAWAIAQQGSNAQAPSSGSSSQESGSQAASAESAIEGCLGGSAGNYTLIDKAGTSYMLQLPNDSQNAAIDKHIGQEVRVNGTVAKADSAATPGAGESKEAAGASKSQATIKVTSLEKVADTCSSSGGAASGKPDKSDNK